MYSSYLLLNPASIPAFLNTIGEINLLLAVKTSPAFPSCVLIGSALKLFKKQYLMKTNRCTTAECHRETVNMCHHQVLIAKLKKNKDWELWQGNMVAIEVQLPQDNTPSREEFPRTARAGACARTGVHNSVPACPPTAHPHSCCTLLIQQKILPHMGGNTASSTSGLRSTPPAGPEPLRSGNMGANLCPGEDTSPRGSSSVLQPPAWLHPPEQGPSHQPRKFLQRTIPFAAHSKITPDTLWSLSLRIKLNKMVSPSASHRKAKQRARLNFPPFS